MISFAAGQAGFTLVVIILFNIIDPAGWKVGLTRIEDVAIGCAVSVVVGLLFWPRGATAALGRALSDAFVTSSGYLADAVDRLTITTVRWTPGRASGRRIVPTAARRRLPSVPGRAWGQSGAGRDGGQPLPGSNRIRLAAYTLATLPVLAPAPGQPELESVAVAGAVLRDSYASSHRWYEEFAELLADGRDSLDPPPAHDETLHGVLRAGLRRRPRARGVTGCAPRCRCSGPTSCSRSRARCRPTWPPRLPSSPERGTTGP